MPPPAAQTSHHRRHVLAPRRYSSEPEITQAKIAHDTQYMCLIAQTDPKIWCFDDLSRIDSIFKKDGLRATPFFSLLAGGPSGLAIGGRIPHHFMPAARE